MRTRRFVIAILPVLTALVSLRCTFSTEDTLMFQQQPVPSVLVRAQVARGVGAPTLVAPRFGLAYQLYFSDPPSQHIDAGIAVDAFPKLVPTTLKDILTVDHLNRGFALGYGNYVLAAAFLVVFDDVNNNGVFDQGEQIVGSSTTEIVVYLQGTPSQELMDQFGALQQGYNLCIKTSQIRGVDLFQVVAPQNYIAVVSVPKAGTAVALPRIR